MESTTRSFSRRQNEIMTLLRENGRVAVEELTALFEVSPQTIRRDLNEMSEARVITRVHGGAIIASGNRTAELRGITVPTLVIHGSLDRLIPLAAARDLARRRPDWTLEILDGVGHVPMMEAPEEFMSALNEWSPYRIAGEQAQSAAS